MCADEFGPYSAAMDCQAPDITGHMHVYVCVFVSLSVSILSHTLREHVRVSPQIGLFFWADRREMPGTIAVVNAHIREAVSHTPGSVSSSR